METLTGDKSLMPKPKKTNAPAPRLTLWVPALVAGAGSLIWIVMVYL
jgi:hypothetical protein